MTDLLVRIADLDAQTDPIVGTDLLVLVDGSDLTQSVDGTTKRGTWAQARTAMFAGGTGFTAADPLNAGLITASDHFAGNVTGNVTGNVSGTAATVTGATQASITTCANLVTVGALNSGSITSGFGEINIGADALTAGAASFTTGAFSGNVTVTNAHVILSNTYYLYGKLTAGTNVALIGRLATSDLVNIDPDGYGTITGGTFKSTGNLTVGASTFVVTAATGAITAGITNGGGSILLGTASPGGDDIGVVRLQNTLSAKNWEISHGRLIDLGALVFTPSTANGGSTFSTPAFYILPTGAATFASSLAITGALTGVTTLAASSSGNFGGATADAAASITSRAPGNATTDYVFFGRSLDNSLTSVISATGVGSFSGLAISGKAFVFGANDSAGAGYRTVVLTNA